mmetsp:Transcript_733/g.2381  ORF Transcript_733/g.2381 Transcript_733/m.2381 type:complete len:290 (+) Transcript_733:470-1339(+)
MCLPPGAYASSTHRCTASLILSSVPKSTIGSTLPCSVRADPSVARASDMDVFQSRPTTSAVLMPSSGSLPAPPLAWNMSGTPGLCARTPAMRRSLYGCENSRNWPGDRWWAQLSKSCTTCAPQSIWCTTYTMRASVRWSRNACSVAGSFIITPLVFSRCLSAWPSVAYAASVQGVPTNPSMVDWPSISRLRDPRISRMKGRSASGSSMGFRARTASMVRTGVEMTGPLPLMTSNSTPRAGSGVRMSLNMMTPSGLKARQGCMESSMAISGVSERIRKGYFVLYSRNAAM